MLGVQFLDGKEFKQRRREGAPPASEMDFPRVTREDAERLRRSLEDLRARRIAREAARGWRGTVSERADLWTSTAISSFLRRWRGTPACRDVSREIARWEAAKVVQGWWRRRARARILDYYSRVAAHLMWAPGGVKYLKHLSGVDRSWRVTAGCGGGPRPLEEMVREFCSENAPPSAKGRDSVDGALESVDDDH